MKYFVGLLAISLLAAASALPRQRCSENEDCYEKQMHPDLPPGATNRAVAGEDKTSFWIENGKTFIADKVNSDVNTKVAKNVILFLGDGLGLTTVAAARAYAGGEEKQLSFEKFPYTGLSKTYSVDRIVPDSANTATAYLCGIKANYGTIGVNGKVEESDCEAGKNAANHVYSAAKWAMDVGKAAGFVTTTRVTHASPSGVYAHVADRDWENDAEIKEACGQNAGLQDIAYQLIHGEVGSKLKVMLGGGRHHFVDGSLNESGKRTDGKNLIDEFKSKAARNVYVANREQLMNVNVASTDRLLGLFNDDHLLYHLNTTEQSNQPTLEEMTRKAIELMQAEENGYFLFIEGGKIDLAHHDTMANMALDETLEFSKAVELARSMTSEDDTLIVVTADHSHSFSYSGYPNRGSTISGSASGSVLDKRSMRTLTYANGPSFYKFFDTQKNVRIDPILYDHRKADAMFPSTAFQEWETHGGDDVPVFASGPWAQLFTGVYEQNTIPHLFAFASCIGDGLKACPKK